MRQRDRQIDSQKDANEKEEVEMIGPAPARLALWFPHSHTVTHTRAEMGNDGENWICSNGAISVNANSHRGAERA